MFQGCVEGLLRENVYTKDKVCKLENDLWNFKHPGISKDGFIG